MITLPKTYHDLREWAIAHFRVKAGFIPKNAPENECSLVDFTVELQKASVHRIKTRVWSSLYDRETDTKFAEVHRIIIRAAICYECASKLDYQYGDDVYVWSWIADDYCQICGEWEDGIPF